MKRSCKKSYLLNGPNVLWRISCIFISKVKDPSNLQYLLLAIMGVSTLFLLYHKTLMEMLLLIMLEGLAVIGFEDVAIGLPLGLLFVLILLVLFIFFEHLRDEQFYIFKYASAAVSGLLVVCSLQIASKYFVSLIMVLLLGIALIFVLFNESYRLGGDSNKLVRNLTLGIFLTFMIFAFRIDRPVITSVLLMVLAIICVGAGFVVKQKPVRLYGLLLALFVCAKLILFDFSGSGQSEKIVLFAVVGLLAIGISYLYMRLEKQEAG